MYRRGTADWKKTRQDAVQRLRIQAQRMPLRAAEWRIAMDQQTNPSGYDYRQYDRIWQRVAPALEPYPQDGAPSPAPQDAQDSPQARQESQLPGAEPNPCCMGTQAAESLQVLTGFIEEILGDRRTYLAMAQQSPSWARQRLRELAAEKASHARRLLAVHYLITGTCYQAAVSCERIYIGRWCPALRERYHAEACNAFNYARAAEGTTDPCLAKIFTRLSECAYRSADDLLAMLERAMQDNRQYRP